MGYWETILKSILLGTVQGLTEFLPVSSSGHLVLLQRVLGYSLEGGSMTFLNLMLHFGTLLAVVLVFFRDILNLFKKPWKMILMLVVATIPAGLAGIFLEDKVDALFAGDRGIFYLSLCFGGTAILLLVCERVATCRKRIYPLGWRQTAGMGIMQAVAILPGISRSGSTIAVGTLTGARVEEASRFSFLMSIPVILGGVVLGLKGAIVDEPSTFSRMGAAGIIGIVLGVAAAAISGFFAIKLMLKIVNKANYKWFAFYLLLLAITSLWLNLVGIL